MTTTPSLVKVVLPPDLAAKSTMTDPGIMAATVRSSTNMGAFLPLNCAVVMMMSDLEANLWISSFCLCKNSSDCCTAYPPAALSSLAPSTSTNLAPSD